MSDRRNFIRLIELTMTISVQIIGNFLIKKIRK